MTEFSWAVSQLDDPFALFPLDALTRDATGRIDELWAAFQATQGFNGTGPRFYTVPEEQTLDQIDMLYGALFVLGQALITQSISLVLAAADTLGRPPAIPLAKDSIMRWGAPHRVAYRESTVVLINAVANYFKHRSEWPETWVSGNANQQKTIDAMVRMGFSPRDQRPLASAYSYICTGRGEYGSLAGIIGSWREALAINLLETERQLSSGAAISVPYNSQP